MDEPAKADRYSAENQQSHLPADLGSYDLRLPEAREDQAAVAQEYGIEEFCYWHYWFAGRRILERPYTEMSESGRPEFPFCLAWANQTWSGIWYDEADRVLIKQTYPGADATPIASASSTSFQLSGTVALPSRGKPLFYLFRPELHPEPTAFVERWRRMAAEAGLEGLYLVAELSDLLAGGPKYADLPKDGARRWSLRMLSPLDRLEVKGFVLRGDTSQIKVACTYEGIPCDLFSLTRILQQVKHRLAEVVVTSRSGSRPLRSLRRRGDSARQPQHSQMP